MGYGATQKMKLPSLTWANVFTAICIGGTVGIVVKFTTLFNHWVYFPAFPNILDAAFLVASVLYLGYRKKNE